MSLCLVPANDNACKAVISRVIGSTIIIMKINQQRKGLMLRSIIKWLSLDMLRLKYHQV